jgi:hypothetical protein
MLPYTGLPQCDEHVEEGSVRKELRSKPFVGAHFQRASSTRDKMEILSPQREVGHKFSNRGCKYWRWHQSGHGFRKLTRLLENAVAMGV